MKENSPPSPHAFALAAVLAAASALSLVGGALVAVPLHGFLRLLAVASGFTGYVWLFGRALAASGGTAAP